MSDNQEISFSTVESPHLDAIEHSSSTNLCQRCQQIDFGALFDSSNNTQVNIQGASREWNIPIENAFFIDSLTNISRRAIKGCSLCTLLSNAPLHRHRWIGGDYDNQEKARLDILNWSLYLIKINRENHENENLLTVFLSPPDNHRPITDRDLLGTSPHDGRICILNGSTGSGHGRIIPPNVNIAILKEWLSSCERSHPECHFSVEEYLAQSKTADTTATSESQLDTVSSESQMETLYQPKSSCGGIHGTVEIADSKRPLTIGKDKPKKSSLKYLFGLARRPRSQPKLRVQLVSGSQSGSLASSRETGLDKSANQYFRLIDVSRRCVLSREYLPANPRYASLSFVWGLSIQGCSLTKARLNQHIDDLGRACSQIPAVLPASLQDAITLAAQMGIKYLWVDCLCIIQDDETDKSCQINNMAAIYQNATICIVAAAGVDANAGLPGVTKPRSLTAQSPVTLSGGMTIGMTHRSFDDVLRDTKWVTRGWTYQELQLSKRTLIFSDDEVLYQCGRLHHRESRYEYWTNPQYIRWDSSGPSKYSIYASHSQRRLDTATKPFISYGTYVQEYSKRVLSHDSDAINAFNGIGRILERHTASTMIFGLLEATFFQGMLWEPLGPLRRRTEVDEAKDISRPLFPSWSWAAWEGKVTDSSVAISSLNLETMINIQKPMLCPGVPATGWETSFASELQPGGSYRSLIGIIPSVTRIAIFDIIQRFETIGIGVRTQYSIYNLPKDGRPGWEVGSFTIGSNQESTIPSRGTFIQLFVAQDYSMLGIVLGHCHVLLIDSNELDLSMSNADRTKVAENFRIMEIDSHAHKNGPPAFQPSKLPCQGLYIDHCCKLAALGKNTVILGSRIGIGSIELDAWREAKPEPAFVLLG